MSDTIVVKARDGTVMSFENAEPTIDQASGRLYISEDGRDIAVYSGGGWMMFGRSSAAEEGGADEFDELLDDDFDE